MANMIDTKVLEQLKEQCLTVENNEKAKGLIRQLAFLLGRVVKLIADLDVRLARLESPHSRHEG